MIETISVSLSSPAFSFLLYENVQTQYDQEGFILGEIVRKETKAITDHDQTQINVTKTIKVNSVVPCPHTCYFYDHVGKVNRDRIKNLLGTEMSKVVAWYKFKRSNSFKFTFREKIIHKQLIELFRDACGDLFTICLLITESSENLATHMYSQTFLRYNNRSYDQLPIHIVNLSDPNNSYKSSEPSSETFNKIVGSLKIDPQKSQGLTVITNIMSGLIRHIDTVVEKLSGAEDKLHALQKEIKDLQKAKANKEMNNKETAEKPDAVENGSDDISEELYINATPSTRNTVARGRGKGSVTKSKRKSPTKANTETNPEVRSIRKRV